MKSTNMDVFTSYAKLNETTVDPLDNASCDDGTASNNLKLPHVQIMTAKSSANCGVSSDALTQCKHKGMPPNFYDIFQEMGRVNSFRVKSVLVNWPRRVESSTYARNSTNRK